MKIERIFRLATALVAFGVATSLTAEDAVPWVYSGSTARDPVTAVSSSGATTMRTKLANDAVASSTSIVMHSQKIGMFIVVR